MMLVVAIAHADELAAHRDYERALDRLSTLNQQRTHGLIQFVQHGTVRFTFDRPLFRALIACAEARSAFFTAQQRHARWYRAYLRRYK